MKTFKDLKFKSHSSGDGLMARFNFKNGFGVSVVRFKITNDSYGSYTDNEQEWEVAILKNDELTYETNLTNDVIGHQSEEDVSNIMKKIQGLK